MTVEERLKALERELATTKAMLAHLLNESPATEVRARRITLIGDNGWGAELRLDETYAKLVLALTGGEGEEISIELAANVAGPVLTLSDNSGRFIELGGDYNNDRWGLTVCDGSRTFYWPPLRR
jgi:hypothetical protein